LLTAQPIYPSSKVRARFSLPDGNSGIDLSGEIAWANPNGQSGMRFVELPDSLRSKLRQWVDNHAQDLPPEDPEPVSECKLSDLSLGACYVETESPFPEHSAV